MRLVSTTTATNGADDISAAARLPAIHCKRTSSASCPLAVSASDNVWRTNSSMAADDRSWLLCDPVSPYGGLVTSERHPAGMARAFQNVDPGRSIAVIGDVRR